jgi:monoamine oxidase
LYPADFCNREEELKNAMVTSRSKVRDLEVKVWEIEAGALELKRAMKEATNSEYAISQKLAYEIGARRGLEADFEAVLKSLQSDQITIAQYEVELNDLKGAVCWGVTRKIRMTTQTRVRGLNTFKLKVRAQRDYDSLSK